MEFAEFIKEQKNTHMTHIEDKVLYGGVKGTRDAILALRSLRDMLGGQHDGNVSLKWDGAPAVFAGIDPSDGRFFVAKKGKRLSKVNLEETQKQKLLMVITSVII